MKQFSCDHIIGHVCVSWYTCSVPMTLDNEYHIEVQLSWILRYVWAMLKSFMLFILWKIPKHKWVINNLNKILVNHSF